MDCYVGLYGEELELSDALEGEVRAESVGEGSTLTHLNARGEAHMVDVTEKSMTFREARATATVLMRSQTLQMIMQGKHAKGDVLAVARIAGIQGAKQCSSLIPLCHPLALTSVNLDFEPIDATDGASSAKLKVSALVKVKGVTGVEMEALTAVSVAALTIYDMCKAVEPQMQITDTRVLGKRGGKADWGKC